MPNSIARGTVLLVLAAGLLAGCATQSAARRDPRDPWEPMNRKIWAFDMFFVRKVALPVGHAYRRVTPQFAQTGIGNFMDNLRGPVVFVNDLLQAKFKPFASDTGRFVLNSTVGIGGLFDPATHAGLPKNDNDFGITLGTWGAGPGPYLVLPFIGMSTVRDTGGRVPDIFLSPTWYINKTWVWVTIDGLYLLDTDSRTLMPAYELLQSQHPFDEYAFARNAYLQQRQYRIHGQSAQSEEEQELELEKSIEDSGPDDKSSGGNAQPPSTAPPKQQPSPPKQ